jgi:hypothetical protein
MIINKSCAFQLPFTRQKQKKSLYLSKSTHSYDNHLRFFFRSGVEYKIFVLLPNHLRQWFEVIFLQTQKSDFCSGEVALIFWLNAIVGRKLRNDFLDRNPARPARQRRCG